VAEPIEGTGVDHDILLAWMDEQGLPTGDVTNWTALAGGTQNVLIRFDRGGRTYVLRRPPLHLRPNSNEVLRREMRVLAALAGTNVPHPEFIAGCPDESVMNGAVFYLMEAIDGFNPTVELPGDFATDAAVQHQMGLAMADAIVALGDVDIDAKRLTDLGKLDGFLDRQVDRWLSELEGHSRHENYPGPDLPGVDTVAEWLRARTPATFTPGLIHGDFHLANVMFDRHEPRVAAIVDWEMTTAGDPLLDLGWLIATWGTMGAGALAHIAPIGEVVARYAEQSSRDTANIEWYGVLACFKLGIILEGTNARAYAGKAPKAIGDMLHASAVGLFERAALLIKEGVQ
jgi:aminoglycoside phosphotransferase (APT) family kinase protein